MGALIWFVSGGLTWGGVKSLRFTSIICPSAGWLHSEQNLWQFDHLLHTLLKPSLLTLSSRITYILVLFTGKCASWTLICSGGCVLSPQRTKPIYFVQWWGKQSGMVLCAIWSKKYNPLTQFDLQGSWETNFTCTNCFVTSVILIFIVNDQHSHYVLYLIFFPWNFLYCIYAGCIVFFFV